jgi:phosphoserine phosphatase
MESSTSKTLAPYTPQEFHAAVLATRPRTAVFDCDGTLWGPDSGLGFLLWSLEHGMVSPERQAWIKERYRLYEAGTVDEATICGEMVQLYAGLPVAAIRTSARAYYEARVVGHIFPAMAALVSALHDAGTELWAVSSTSKWVIEAGVWGDGRGRFQIPPERILAVEVAVEAADQTAGLFPTGGPGNAPEHGPVRELVTDRLIAVPTDEAKAAALAVVGLAHPDAVFGNSIHDAAMLAIARDPFPVNPTPGLRELARLQGWRLFEPMEPV